MCYKLIKIFDDPGVQERKVIIIIGQKKWLMDIDIIDDDIALSGNKGVTKQMNMKLNFTKPTAIM